MTSATLEIGRAPLATVRPSDLAGIYVNPSSELKRLADNGTVHRLARGYFCLVPHGQDPRVWKPDLETAAAAVATAAFGDRVPVMMGMSAARVLQAFPRAIGDAWVAVPAQHKPVTLTDRDGTVRFVTRDVARLDVRPFGSELGAALTTSPEQTILDLARRSVIEADAVEAIKALWNRAELHRMEKLAAEQKRKASLRRAQDLV